jgi:uroporphyrinogen decarboxylase
MKAENVLLETIKGLRRVPTPKGMTSREIVRRTIEFKDPPRIPYCFYFNPSATDIIIMGPLSAAATSHKGKIGDQYTDDWGTTWEVTGRLWDHPIRFPLEDLGKLDKYKTPDVTSPINNAIIRGFSMLAYRSGKYMLALNPLYMFETMRSIMGFEELMMAPYRQPDGLRNLLDRLGGIVIDAISIYARLGTFDGFITYEDWGMQNTLQMKIDTFREFYKPVYKRIIDECHKYKMHYFWHCCGYILDLLPEMLEIGVDVVQLDQPRLMGHRKLIDMLGGKLCMWNTVDIQWSTSEDVTDDEIRKEVAEMVRIYDVNRYRGGYIAKHYNQPWDINLPAQRQRLIADAFMQNGCSSL